MRRFFLLFLLVAGCSCGSDPKTGTSGDAGADASDDGGGDGSVVSCGQVNMACTGPADCCSSLTCDTVAGLCIPQSNLCAASGASCTTSTDCCSNSCNGLGKCATTCIQDSQACGVNGDCCSGNCQGNVCVAAVGSPSCTTTGNACGSGKLPCCSGNCQNGTCAASGGTCKPQGDTCFDNADCCSSVCSQNGTGVGGVCLALNTSGTGQCSMAGEVCNDCGSCCSRTCIPTTTGAHLCAQASGCRIEGELCTNDDDCCGGPNSGLPGAGAGRCSKVNAGDTYGRCGQYMSGVPQGGVCKVDNTYCGGGSSSSAACIGCNPPKQDCCAIDPSGTPRCNVGSACVPADGVCAFTAECCNGAACLPDNTGVLRCGSSCQPQGQSCRASTDCCVGLACNIPAGSTTGSCQAPPPPPPPADGGVDSGVDASVDAGTPPLCSQLGQSCSASQGCCTGLLCGTAANPSGGCPSGSTCSCFGIIQ